MPTETQDPGDAVTQRAPMPEDLSRAAWPSAQGLPEREGAFLLWCVLQSIRDTGSLATPRGLPIPPIARVLVRIVRARRQSHLFRPLRIDARYLARVVRRTEAAMAAHKRAIAARRAELRRLRAAKPPQPQEG